MRGILFLFLAFILAGCTVRGTPILISTEMPDDPTPTPGVLVQTVVVTVIVTEVPHEIPLSTAFPSTQMDQTQQPIPSSATSVVAATVDSRSVTLDSGLGGDIFPAITLTGKILSLRCQAAHQITFQVAPSDPDITQVDFYYRIEDRTNNAIFDWQGPYRMTADAKSSFTLQFSGEDVNPNFRKPNAWLDFQFVGWDESGARVGNSEKIVQQVRYTFDCP